MDTDRESVSAEQQEAFGRACDALARAALQMQAGWTLATCGIETLRTTGAAGALVQALPLLAAASRAMADETERALPPLEAFETARVAAVLAAGGRSA